MTTDPTLNGQVIGRTARATHAVMEALLADVGTDFPSWVLLDLATTAGPAPAEELVGRATGVLRSDQGAVADALGALDAAGLVRRTGPGGTLVEVTTAGAELHARIRGRLAGITERIYGDLPPEDVATTARVLALVAERATSELSR